MKVLLLIPQEVGPVQSYFQSYFKGTTFRTLFGNLDVKNLGNGKNFLRIDKAVFKQKGYWKMVFALSFV